MRGLLDMQLEYYKAQGGWMHTLQVGKLKSWTGLTGCLLMEGLNGHEKNPLRW